MKQLSTSESEVTIGLDVGDKTSHAVVIGADGEWLEECRVRTTPEAMAKAFGGREGARVVMEVGTHSGWLSRALEARGFEVVVAHSQKVRLIAEGWRKNDRSDAEVLARLGRMDPELLAPVQHRSAQAQRDMILVRGRDGLVRSRTQLINEVRGFAKSLGLRVPACSTDSFVKRTIEALGRDAFPGLDAQLTVITELNRQIRQLDDEIEQLANERYPETKVFRQIGGIGPIIALSYALTIADPQRFSSSRKVGAYLGLCPRQRDSGDEHPQLRISKTGDELLRRHLVNAAHYILGPHGPDSDLRRYGLRLCARGGKNAKKRAVVAVARKLAVLLHRLWVTGEVYVPLDYSVARRPTSA